MISEEHNNTPQPAAVYRVGDTVRVVKQDSPIYGMVGTIQFIASTMLSPEDGIEETALRYHVLVDGSSFHAWFLAHELTPPSILTQQELLFAQMRGILLHLNERSGWANQECIHTGADAMEVFYGYATECGYEAVRDQFNQVPDGYSLFIDYWNSFLIEDDDEEDVGEEPDMSDDFPLSLEYDDDNPGTIALESMLESGEEDFDVPTLAETTYQEMGDPYGEY